MPTDRSQAVTVPGLDDFRRDLKAMGDDLARELGQANRAAAEIVGDRARSKAQSLGGVHAKTGPSIKESGASATVRISIGGPKYPFALGAEFGSKQFLQFPVWAGNGDDAGYMLNPAIRETQGQFMAVYEQMLQDLSRRAYPD